MSVVAKDNTKQKSSTARRLLGFCGPEAVRISIGITALVVNAITNLSFPSIMEAAVDQTFKLEVKGDYLFLVNASSIFLVGSLASWIRVYCIGTAKDRITSRLRKLLFDSYIEQDKDFFDSSHKGELIVALEKDVTAAAEAFTDKIQNGLRSMNSAINGSYFLYQASPSLCGISLAFIPVVGMAGMAFAIYSRKLSEKVRVVEGTLTSFAIERFERITTVRLNGREAAEKAAFAGYIDECTALSHSSLLAQGAFMGFTNIAGNASLVAVLFFGGRLISQGKMTAGSLTKFAIQSGFVGLGFSGLYTAYSDLKKSLAAAERYPFHFTSLHSITQSLTFA